MNSETQKRRTFAIISHPDAGKTTLTERLLLLGGAINLAGTVKARKSARHATSDWMELEKQRGISISTSVMQIHYGGAIINLLDTPGHADFSEDTYRTLTAVDSALMMIDSAKGVEQRTIKLMEICRLRKIPIVTFINKLDREGLEPFKLMDEIEKVLSITCVPMTWPMGMGRSFRGVHSLKDDEFYIYPPKNLKHQSEIPVSVKRINHPYLVEHFSDELSQLKYDIDLIQNALTEFDNSSFLKGEITPVYFGSALNGFGVELMLRDFIRFAPPPLSRVTDKRLVESDEDKFSGFVFKIQANMDPKHHDRLAFLRIVSGHYKEGLKMYQVRTNKQLQIKKAMNLFASERAYTEEAWAGDIIGIHNYGNILIGDTFTEGEKFQFKGIPNFAPELFRTVRLKNPLKSKALLKGLIQLCEEGATQVFRPLTSNDLILGAVGMLQFDVVAYRLEHEYGVECVYDQSNIQLARWVSSNDNKLLEEFKLKLGQYLAYDGEEQLTYLAPSRVHFNLIKDKWPGISFHEVREHIIPNS